MLSKFPAYRVNSLFTSPSIRALSV